MSKLYFFRHAQASFGAANYDQLSPKGEQQAAELGKYLVTNHHHFDKIFVGPLVRQRHTFEIVRDIYAKNGLSLPTATVLQGLKEHEATTVFKSILPQLVQTVPQVKKWYTEMEATPKLRRRNGLLCFQYFMNEWVEGKIPPQGAEPWHLFRKNVKKGLETILENTEKGQNIGIFTSGGTISAITAEALKLTDEQRVASMNFSVRNTSFSTFLFSKQEFNLLSFNELPHLEKDMITFV